MGSLGSRIAGLDPQIADVAQVALILFGIQKKPLAVVVPFANEETAKEFWDKHGRLAYYDYEIVSSFTPESYLHPAT